MTFLSPSEALFLLTCAASGLFLMQWGLAGHTRR